MEFNTDRVHRGVYRDREYNSVTTPIYPSSTYYFEKLGVTKGYDYGRSGNPTRSALEENLAHLEGGAGCTATATGMAAVTALLFLLRSGDHVVTGNDIYGGTYRAFYQLFTRMGIEFSFVNMREPEEVRRAIREQTKMVWMETPSNPLMNIVDIEQIVGIAKQHGCTTVCDNTFLTPYFQRPLDFGVDYVMHSTTKYINGHSDVVGGAVIGRTETEAEEIAYVVNAIGLPEAPFDAWLVLRGVKTLGPRMEAHQRNALAVARFLEQHPRVRRVLYPGLESHPQQELIARQMTGHGGMLSFEIDTEAVSLDQFFRSLRLFLLAESLGGVESLVEHPWSMSHASMGAAGLAASGITEETVRVSIGIEDEADLIADLGQALGG
jgi:cystathionine beta-lyase/cystathionine gamma-synthase